MMERFATSLNSNLALFGAWPLNGWMAEIGEILPWVPLKKQVTLGLPSQRKVVQSSLLFYSLEPQMGGVPEMPLRHLSYYPEVKYLTFLMLFSSETMLSLNRTL